MTMPQLIYPFSNQELLRWLQMFSYYKQYGYEQSRTHLLVYMCKSFSQVLLGNGISGLLWSCFSIIIWSIHALPFLLCHLLFITTGKIKFHSKRATTSLSPFFSPNMLQGTPTLNLKATSEQKDCILGKSHSHTFKWEMSIIYKPIRVRVSTRVQWLRAYSCILSTQHPSESSRQLPKTQILLKILERHSKSKFLILYDFPLSFHLHILLQPKHPYPTPATLVIPLLSPCVWQPKSCLAFSILTKWLT